MGSLRVSVRYWSHHHAQSVVETESVLEAQPRPARTVPRAVGGFHGRLYALPFLAPQRNRSFHAGLAPQAAQAV